MNDSFLEDLELIPKDTNVIKNIGQPSSRYITTRSNITLRNECDNIETRQDKIISSGSTSIPKIRNSRSSGSQEPRKSLEVKTDGKPQSSTPKSDKKKKQDENIVKPAEHLAKIDELRNKAYDVKGKLQDKKVLKDNRRSGSSGGSSRYLDASSKENTRPSLESTSSRESGTQADLKKERRVSDSAKKSDILEKTDPVMFLSAIKDLVSRYTEQETVKVLRAMQSLHINSQANLIKHLMLQTSELVKELDLSKNSGNIKSLIEENERMREDIMLLRTRNETLQKKVDEMVMIREENISLKLKLKEIQQ